MKVEAQTLKPPEKRENAMVRRTTWIVAIEELGGGWEDHLRFKKPADAKRQADEWMDEVGDGFTICVYRLEPEVEWNQVGWHATEFVERDKAAT